MRDTFKLLLICLMLLMSKTCFCQYYSEQKIDSLLLVAESLENGELNNGLTLSLKGYEYSKSIDYKKGMSESLIIASRKFNELGKYDEVLKKATEAEKIAISISNPKEVSDALRLKGIALTKMNKLKEGRFEFQKAIQFAQKLNENQLKSSRLGVLYNDIAYNIDLTKGSIDSVIFYYKKGFREFEKMNLGPPLKEKTISLACSNIGYNFLRLKELDSSEFYLRKGLKLANSVNHEPVKVIILNDLGKLYHLKKNFDLSISSFNESIYSSKKINTVYSLRDSYLGLSITYKEKKDIKNSEYFLQKFKSLNDSLRSNDKKNFYENTNEYDPVEEKLSSRSIIFLIIFTIVVLMCGSVFLKKAFKRKVVTDVITSRKKTNNADFEVTEIQKLMDLACSDAPSFLTIFKIYYPNFFANLYEICPTLIPGELKICAYVKLDFSTKRIAQCTNSSIRSVEAKKYRIRKKLNIPSDIDINIWMIDI